MPPTRINGSQVRDGTVQRVDLDTTTLGQAVVARVAVNASYLSMSSTGVDAGTGDVTFSLVDSGVTPGEYQVVTVDVKGRVTGGRALAAADLPTTGIGTGIGTKFTYDNYGRITAVSSLVAGDIPSGSTYYVQNQGGSAQSADGWVTGFLGAQSLRSYNAGNTLYTELVAPAGLAANRSFSLPATYGSNGDALIGNGAGVLSWTNLSSTYVPVAGATTISGLKTFSAGIISNGTTSVSAFAHVGSGAFSATRLVLTGAASTDTVARFSIMEDGRLEWGSGGASARDTFLIRETGGGLRTATKLHVSTSATSLAGLFLVNGGSMTSAVNGVYRLLLHFEGANGSRKFQDSGAYNAPAYTRGSNYYSVPTISTVQKKFGSSSLLLDGNSYLEVGFLWSIGTGDFSVDFHVRFTSVAGTQTLVDVGGTAGLQLSYSAGTWTAVLAGTACTFTNTPSVNTWYHIAISRTTGSVRFFIEGTKTGTTQTASGSMMTGTSNAFIGATSAGANRASAYIDEFRFITSWSSYQSDSNIAVPSSAYDPFGYRQTTSDSLAQTHEGKVMTGDAAGNFSPQRPARSAALVFALPENVANTSKYFYARRGPGATQEDAQRSGNSSGLSYANACSPEFSPVNGRITSAVLVVPGVGVNNGSVTYPVIFRADLFRVGFSAEHDPNINSGSAVQLNFNITSGVGTYSVGSTNARVVLQDLNIPVLAGDPISLKFVNGSGASGAAIMQMAFVTLTIEETF